MKSYRLLLTFLIFLFAFTNFFPALAKVDEESVIKEMKEEGPVEIEANELIYDRDTQMYEAHGRVEVRRGELSLQADHVQLNMNTKALVAWGNIVLREGEDVVECERLEVNVETRLGRIYQGKLFLKDQNFHITGREVEKLGENHYRIKAGSLTTCDAKRPPWKFTVKELEVKEMALGGWAIAKGPIFYIEEIPVLYFPWGAFPVRQERQSGFLIPKAGYSSKYGPELKNGFYWAFAKNMDTTFYLDWLGERGVKEGLEFRYALTQETKGETHLYFIDDQEIHRNRYAFFIEHQQGFPDDFYLKGDINRISDRQYLRDFDEDLPDRVKIDSRSLRQLRSTLFGGKDWEQFSFLVDLEVFDDLTRPSNDETIQKIPQISFYAHPQSLLESPIYYEINTSYTHFWRERGVGAHRGDFFPKLFYPLRLFNVLKVEPNIGLRETLYRSYEDPTRTYQGWESRETLETGLKMSMEFIRIYHGTLISRLSKIYEGSKWMHLIEPTLEYSYSPRVDQDEIPTFDEVDRIPYSNQITYGFTQSLVGKVETEGRATGPQEYGRLRIFQSYSLGDPFVDRKGEKHSLSNIQGELWWRFNPYVSFHGEAEFNPHRWSFDRFNLSVKAKDQRNDAIQIQYRNTRGDVKTINLDARIRTISPLYLYGSFRYNLLEGIRIAGIYGAEYQAQCWSAGFVFEDINRSPDRIQGKERKFHFYFNLLNIGSVGHRPYFMSL